MIFVRSRAMRTGLKKKKKHHNYENIFLLFVLNGLLAKFHSRLQSGQEARKTAAFNAESWRSSKQILPIRKVAIKREVTGYLLRIKSNLPVEIPLKLAAKHFADALMEK